MNFRKILVPVDFSKVTESAAGQAFDLARSQGAEVVLLTVINDAFPYPELFSFDTPNDDYYRALRDKALAAMSELVAKFGSGIQVEKIVTRGAPAPMIADFAAKEKVDLIVMSTHGTSGLQHVLLGSVTERVLHHAPCAVLIFRVPGPLTGKGA